MIRKLLSAALAAVLLLVLLPMGSYADETENGFTYTIENGKATVTGVTEAITGNLTIPNTLGGCPVTAIGDRAFEKAGFSDLYIPESVTHIGDSAFRDCTELTVLYIPNNVDRIGASAFEGCTGLVNVFMWELLTDVGDRAFYGCTGLVSEEMIVVNRVLYAYYGVNSWVEVPGNVMRISAAAFRDNATLVDILIPRSVEEISAAAFSNCSKLEDLWYYGSEEEWAKMTIHENNPSLNDARLHYGTCQFEHSFSGACDGMCNNCEWTRPAGEHGFDDDNDMICNACFHGRTPPRPIAQSVGITSVALQGFTGCEYSADGKVWQDSPIFENLTPETTYVFYQRVKETEHSKQSEISEGLTLATVKATICGDVDVDDAVTSSDARMVLQYYAGKMPMLFYFPSADVDRDGEITSTDARLILQYYAGKIEDFPI